MIDEEKRVWDNLLHDAVEEIRAKPTTDADELLEAVLSLLHGMLIDAGKTPGEIHILLNAFVVSVAHKLENPGGQIH